MYYSNANYAMGGNFKINKAAPIDNRATVAKLIHLSDSNIFDGFTYNGMIVSVVEDGTNNGIYVLEDKEILKWKKQGGNITAVQTTGESTTDVMSQDAVSKELAKKVDKDGNKQLSEENYTSAEKTKLGLITDNFKSGFANATARDEKLTDPKDDWYVLMYDTDTIWYYKDGAWIDTGNKSTGDMLKAIYDPTSIGKDAFSMANMIETLDKLIFTKAERSKLSAIEANAQVNKVNKVNGKVGDIVLSKDDFEDLNKVDNIPDSQKVVKEAKRTTGELTINGKKWNGSENLTIEIDGGSGGTGVTYATDAEVAAGLIENKAINPKTLKNNNYSKTETDAKITEKTQFKTINNQSLHGDGNINIKQDLYNYGFTIEKIFDTVKEMNDSILTSDYKDTNLVMVRDDFASIYDNSNTLYISPTGDDNNGDGSRSRPYKTFAKIPTGSLVLLMEGEYKTSEYGRHLAGWSLEVHGLFKGLMEAGGNNDNRPIREKKTLIPPAFKTKLSGISSVYDRFTTVTVVTKETPTSNVKIILDVDEQLSGSKAGYKPFFVLYGASTDLLIYRDLVFEKRLTVNPTGYAASIMVAESSNQKSSICEDCSFSFNNKNYGYLYSSSSKIMFIRNSFLNGTLVGTDSPIILNNNDIETKLDLRSLIKSDTYIFLERNKIFIPFIYPKAVDGTPYPITYKGLSELPSPEIGVETLTSERWVDGRPIWMKAINFGALPNKTTKLVPHGVIGLGNYYGIMQSKTSLMIGTTSLNIPSVNDSIPAYNFSVNMDNINVSVRTSEDRSTVNAIIVIYYTKAAQNASSPVALVGGLSEIDFASLEELELGESEDKAINPKVITDFNKANYFNKNEVNDKIRNITAGPIYAGYKTTFIKFKKAFTGANQAQGSYLNFTDSIVFNNTDIEIVNSTTLKLKGNNKYRIKAAIPVITTATSNDSNLLNIVSIINKNNSATNDDTIIINNNTMYFSVANTGAKGNVRTLSIDEVFEIQDDVYLKFNVLSSTLLANAIFNFTLQIEEIVEKEVILNGLSEIPSSILGEEILTSRRHPVNGKRYWSKTIDFGTLPNNTTKTLAHGLTNIDFIKVDYNKSYIYQTGNTLKYPLVWAATPSTASQWNCWVDSTNISMQSGLDRTIYRAYIVLIYTKITDTIDDSPALVGSIKRGLPGPAGNDGNVSFNDLTEEQREMLLNNKNIVTRQSGNILLSNLTPDICILDVSSRISLPEKVKITTTDNVVYNIEDLNLTESLIKIGDCKYVNISNDLIFDIYNDNSTLLVYPLQTDSHDLGGRYNGVDTGVTYNNNKAVFNGAAKITPTAFTIPEEMTVSFYVTFTELGSFMIFDFGGGKAIYLYNDNRIRAQYSNANNAHKSTTSPIVKDKEYFVTAVIKNNSADIYIDGELQTNTAWANYVTSMSLCLGSRSNNSLYSKMLLNSVRIFTRALSASEIKYMHDNRVIENLELYHASGINLKDANILQRTVTLNVPRYLNDSDAMKYGLKQGDMYYTTSGIVRYVQ